MASADTSSGYPRHGRQTHEAAGGEHRDVVLEELNHRWFNSLQILSGSLHSLADTSPDALRDRLGRMDLQIQAMAALHRRLARSPGQHQTLEAYCQALCIDVLVAFGREEITPWVRMCDVDVSPAVAICIGALVVELLTNALKHGRAPAEGGTVWISMKRLTDGRLELAAADSFPAPTTRPLRPRMVEGLVGRLRGELSIQMDTGYMTRIRFPAA
jgi:two-component sensor histidine kinase